MIYAIQLLYKLPRNITQLIAGEEVNPRRMFRNDPDDFRASVYKFSMQAYLEVKYKHDKLNELLFVC